MNIFKKLAGETAVYGLSSIVGRFLNFLLIPIYTRKLDPEEFGVYTEMYTYVTFLLPLFTYGMETAFFRFYNNENNKVKVYNSIFSTLLISTSFLIFGGMFFNQNIASALGYGNYTFLISGILFITVFDILSTIPFAKLRSENKAFKFAGIKIFGILLNIVLNLFFILLCPILAKGDGSLAIFIQSFYRSDFGVGYILISNLIPSGLIFLWLLIDSFPLKFTIDTELMRKVWPFALPMLLIGLAGTVNETIDRLMLKYMLPANESLYQLGIYSACYRISMFMTILIQAYRFAAEPFFFDQASKADSKQTYARLMNYFVALTSVIFLLITLFQDIFIQFIGKEFHAGKDVIPILLMANLMLGIYFNLSVWYKISTKTIYGSIVSGIGAFLTIILNLALIPVLGYMGSAWTTLLVYTTMVVLSYYFGKKHFPIPYDLKTVSTYLGLALLLFFVFKFTEPQWLVLKYSYASVLLFGYSFYVVKKEGFLSFLIRKKS